MRKIVLALATFALIAAACNNVYDEPGERGTFRG